ATSRASASSWTSRRRARSACASSARSRSRNPPSSRRSRWGTRAGCPTSPGQRALATPALAAQDDDEEARQAEHEPCREEKEGPQEVVPQRRQDVALHDGLDEVEAARAQAKPKLARGDDVIAPQIKPTIGLVRGDEEGREDQDPAEDAKDASQHHAARPSERRGRRPMPWATGPPQMDGPRGV